MMFVSPRPYLALGLLREVIAYPGDVSRFDDTTIRAALIRTGLGNLIERLDEKERWDKILSVGEQQRLILARLLIHAPRWVFLEDAMLSMDTEDCGLMLSIFEQELSSSAVIGIGSAPALDGFYHRTLYLSRTAPAASSAVQEGTWSLPALQAAE
jgi:putative ATP-binding cassette transporter